MQQFADYIPLVTEHLEKKLSKGELVGINLVVLNISGIVVYGPQALYA